MGMQEMAQAVEGKLYGPDVIFNGVSTDTRTLHSGDLFIALQGPNFDGHEFLQEAQVKNAAGALVSRAVNTDLPRVAVDDTRLGLGRLGGYWRNKFHCPVVAVTGSNGKTTVKEMLGAILRRQGDVLVSSGNLNNDIGLPLVLCRMRDGHSYAVVEMGMSRPGEIDYLTRLARPQVAVITNAAMAHLEGLGSVQAVATAKAEIFSGLRKGGVAIINLDDDFASLWQRVAAGRKQLTFAMNHPADVKAAQMDLHDTGSVINIDTPSGSCEVTLSLPGKHNVMNALAATSAAIALGIELTHIKRGLQSMSAVPGRLHRLAGKCGATVIDDTYNANPNSMAAAVQVLAANAGCRILVMGDMGELGAGAEQLHTQVGEQARCAGIERLLTCGELSASAARAFGPNAQHFDDKNSLVDALLQDLDASTTVLVKGSRFMHMEDVVQAIAKVEVPN